MRHRCTAWSDHCRAAVALIQVCTIAFHFLTQIYTELQPLSQSLLYLARHHQPHHFDANFKIHKAHPDIWLMDTTIFKP
ncbi:hypothetical protein AB205_0027020 [Aquarana catesbeiana]|uniref:Fatty acid hydroxylase domain-containing protein n=1 Tax=Aquarana catesbeiana TaxID=8400 RepID=A0A2G9P173_AQUCT|nr:hypothetical protein AB205_0027020 [Aquarana catesbeiana]